MLGSALVLAAACSSTGEESQSEPVSSATNALESGVDGGASKVLLNEIKVNPNGTDPPNEWVELRGTPGGLLTNVHFVVLEGEFDAVDSGSGPSGEVDYTIDLGTACGGNPCALGSNGLLLLGAAAVHTPPVPGTTHVTDARFAVEDSQVFENGSASFALIYSEFPLEPPLSADGGPVAFDLDMNDDGTLELPPGAFVIDGIGYAEDSADVVYGTELEIAGDGPAAATRLSANTMENSASAWFYGDLASGAGNNVYAPASGIPIDARLTPGAPNVFGTTPDAGGDAGGGTGGSAGDASVGTGGTAGSAGTGGTGTDAGRDGSAGTGGTGTDAGRDGSAGTGAGGTGGSAGSAGSPGTGGSAGAAGSPGTGGSAGAATAGTGGRAGSAGAAGRDGGRAGSAGTRGGGDDDEDDGCSCSTPTASHTPSGLFAMLAALSLLGWRRKRR
ncbi:MAG TPA: MYXO-CTERM sorting domain-containing protein [Polyangiaceae bacterium]